MQSMLAPALTYCSACGKEGLQKHISATSFQLKGSGWYVTDHKDKKPAESLKNDTTVSKEDKTVAEKTSKNEE